MVEKVGGIAYDVTLDLSQMGQAEREVAQRLGRVGDEGDKLKTRLTAVASAVGVLGTAMMAVRVAKLADDMRLLEVRVRVAAGSMEEGVAAMAALEEMSRRTQTSVEANAEVFTRLNSAMKAMGGTQEDTLALTETLAKAIKVSGASAVEAKSAMLQFGQALGSGKLAGDELRSLMETAPYLMRQLADGIGVPVGALKKLGEEGKLTSDVVANAMRKASQQISEDFAKFPQTFDSAVTVLEDAAMRANKSLDEMTNSSVVLTGVTKGLTEVVDALTREMAGLKSEADSVGRNTAITSWANTTKVALSYLIDAADLAWQTLSVLGRNVAFVFQGVGTEIGGLTAQAMAVARGDFEGAKAIGEAMKADAAKRRAELDAADAATLGRTKLAGQRMREAWEQGAGGGRGFVNPPVVSGAPSVLKPVAQEDDKKGKKSKAKKEKADTDPLGSFITDQLNAQGKRDERASEQAAQQQQQGRDLAMQAIVGQDPIAQLQYQLDQKSRLLKEAAERDAGNADLYAQAQVALEQETWEKMRQVREQARIKESAEQLARLQGYSQMFDSMAGIIATFAGKQSGVYKAMFAASKAFAIAESIVKIQQGIATAAALPFPVNLGAMATVAASTAGIVSTIQGTNYAGGRQYGGPVSAGSMYRVNETGRPEMFVAANGNQYMMPTQGGQVVPAGSGAATAPTVIINNLGPAQTVTQQNWDAQANTISVTVAEVASQIRDNSGPVWNALRSSTNVQGRL